MKHSDFHIGLVFSTAIGRWKCTDVGQRTVTAIHLDDERYPDEPRWTEGPPYGLKEQVLNEQDIRRAYRNLDECLGERLTSLHASQRHFPSEYVFDHLRKKVAMRKAMKKGGPEAYPLDILVGIRLKDGDELTMGTARRGTQGDWILEGFNFTRQVAVEMPEAEWFALPMVSDTDA